MVAIERSISFQPAADKIRAKANSDSDAAVEDYTGRRYSSELLD